MKTITINGVRKKLEYRTSTDMYTPFRSPVGHRQYGQFCGDVYNVIDGDQKVLIAAIPGGTEIRSTATVLSANEYEKLSDMYNPYDGFAYHNAVMNAMGFTLDDDEDEYR